MGKNTAYSNLLYSELCDTKVLLNTLQKILLDEFRLQELSRFSYRHENGHCKLLLSYINRNAPAVRLHIWDPPSAESPTDIHSHAWNFRSSVVAGSLVNMIYDSTPGQCDGDKMFEYAVRLGDRHYTGHHLQCLGRTTLTETGRYHLPSGSEYGFAAGVIHQVMPGCDGAISVFLQMPFEREESRLFRTQQQNVDSVRVSLFSIREVGEIIEKAIVRITELGTEESEGWQK